MTTNTNQQRAVERFRTYILREEDRMAEFHDEWERIYTLRDPGNSAYISDEQADRARERLAEAYGGFTLVTVLVEGAFEEEYYIDADVVDEFVDALVDELTAELGTGEVDGQPGLPVWEVVEQIDYSTPNDNYTETIRSISSQDLT